MGILRNIKTTHFFWDLSNEFLHLLGIAGLICAVDQMVKSAIDTEPEDNFPRDMPHTKGYIKIMRAHNPGFSRGRLGEYPELVKNSSIAAVGFLAGGLQYLTSFYPKQYKLKKLGMAIVIGGALSNVLDRIVNGKVTDYLNIRVSGLKSLIVNIGDIAIYVGGIIYIISAFIKKED
ncbi:signal peptidase II [Oribacterium sp. WCC10]|uniref:signal peptidase II n=1 Tax=Oribacterium sp. WCC10 TaxID=1855343 RepID=UPI0008E0F3DF|nr:signal peptidase II [Oribacterium sp. WCC10]SFG31963.1 signal peptidase II [Oribacterium sp. WCC10]